MFLPSISPSNLTETTIWITSADTTWDVPANWNPDSNSVECIGGGAGGARRGPGGCGGHYAKASNLDITGTVNISVGAGGGPATDGGDTWFGGSDFDTSLCGAKGGKAGSDNSTAVLENYAASLNQGDVSFPGGNGGQNPSTDPETGFPGGGGAAGPLGAGGNGGLGGGGVSRDGGGGGGGANNGQNGEDGTDTVGGNGGDSGSGGIGGTAAEAATDGAGGVGANQSSLAVGDGADGSSVWTRSSNSAQGGPGGGGGGSSGGDGNTDYTGGGGGLFGGGGGAGEEAGERGARGIIVIKYRHTT